jgi:acetoin utilization protein AcuC
VFNDLAICILKLRQDFGFKRVAYIDFDAHHGDGVVFGFYEDKDVLTIDYHEDGRYLFPGTGGMEEVGRGQGLNTKFNIPLPPYSSDHSFIYAFDELVPPLLRKFQPEFILLQMGVDAHGGDPLSDMNFSANSYLHATRQIRNLADELCEGRLVMFGGGGYNLETCALRWTEMSASLIDFKMPDFVPQDWREFYQRQTKQEAAVTFIEDFTKDNTFERVVKIVNYLKMRGGLE